MKKEKFGIKIRDRDGKPVLEVGSHIIQEAPEFSKKIGAIAALWAQAEVNLNCLFAVLLDTTPDDAKKQLKKYNGAAKTTNAARELAAEYLEAEELQSVTDVLTRLDLSRSKRNRVQHDVWAKKGDTTQTLFAIHSNEYFEFTTKLLALTESTTQDNENYEAITNLAAGFSEKVSVGYTIADFLRIEDELNLINGLLMKAMFFRLSQRSEGK
ncbi:MULTISPECIES: hypothetical protein [unclassified Pseudomonas]|uniref:hypothetical protein n=1 Tax=unclassified Pseudomonas TaxID=196821 RepID=UPI001F58C831|nr:MULTISPECIES: hypothetical protein [unclassified Pseudomonas]